MKTGGRYVRHGGRGRARSSTPSRSRRSLVRPLRGSGPPFAQHSHTRSDRADAHARARKCHRPRTQQQWCDIRSLSIAALSCLSLPSPLPHGTRQPLVPSPVARRSPALCRQCAVLVVGSSACFSLLQLASACLPRAHTLAPSSCLGLERAVQPFLVPELWRE